MNEEFILQWFLAKYCPKIIEFIAVAIEYEELTPEALEVKRRQLLLDYLDTCESHVLIYLFAKVPDLHDRLYKAIYTGPVINDNIELTDSIDIKVKKDGAIS